MLSDVPNKSPRRLGWILLAGACVAFGAWFGVWKVRNAPKLPALARYVRLPAIFDQVLHNAREKVRDNGYRPDDLRSLAHLYQANRLDAEALACYQIRTLASVLIAQDHYYLADIAQYQGDLERAGVELRAVLASEPSYLPARLQLADSLFKTGDDAGAEREYTAALAVDANQPQALFGLARIDLLRGNDDAAVAQLSGLMASHPEMTSGAGLLAQVFDRRGETAKAAAMTQWSRQKPEPAVPDPWMDSLLSDCYDTLRLSLKFEEDFESGQIEKAVPLLHRVEELDPQSPIPQLLRGWTFARDHQDDEAVQEYRKALEKGGDAEKICPYLVQSLLALGRVKEAAALLAEYSEKKPDSIPILIAYSDVAVRQGDSALARTLLSKVVLKEPYLYAANVNLAKILWAAGERDEAARCLVRITEVSANDVASRAQLAEYYLGKADPVSAIAPLEQAVAIKHTQESVRQKITSMLYLAYLQAGEAAGGRALDFVEKAIRLMPEQPSAYAVKASLCAQSKQYPAAADALAKLESLQPANPTVCLSLGDVLYQEGNGAEARRNWQKAFDLTSANDAALRTAIANRLNGPITEDTFR